MELTGALRLPPPDLVFPGNGLEGWCHPNTLSHALTRLAEQAECPRITVRSLRHFHATLSLRANQNVVVVSKRLGHSKVSITLDIRHLRPCLARLAERGSGSIRQRDGSRRVKMLDKCWTKFQQGTSSYLTI